MAVDEEWLEEFELEQLRKAAEKRRVELAREHELAGHWRGMVLWLSGSAREGEEGE